MSGSNSFPIAQQLPPQQPLGGGMGTSPLAAAIMGRPSNFQLPAMSGSIPIPLLSMMMNQLTGGQGGGATGAGQASDAARNAAWGSSQQGAPFGSAFGAGQATDVPIPPSAFMSAMPSWLGGPSSSGY